LNPSGVTLKATKVENDEIYGEKIIICIKICTNKKEAEMRTFQQGEEKLNVTDKAIRVLIAIGIIGIIIGALLIA